MWCIDGRDCSFGKLIGIGFMTRELPSEGFFSVNISVHNTGPLGLVTDRPDMHQLMDVESIANIVEEFIRVRFSS